MNEARKRDLPGVALTIENENPASERIIERNGGKLLRTIVNPIIGKLMEEDDTWVVRDVEQTGETWKLYWIDLTQ